MPDPVPVKLPKSIMTASRVEYYGQDAAHQPIELTVKQGQLPDDIHGYMFIDVPVGSVEQGDESGPGEPVFAGDGMIYQLDFSAAAEGRAVLKTRLTTPPSFIADKVTQDAPKGSDLHKLKFSDMGLGRLSFKLGMRNDLNTAFLPFKFKDDDRYRMLITSDDGRPFEIDPETLETVTPMGYNKEWRSILGSGIKLFGIPFGVMPFQLFMGTAHPVFDPQTSELFSANYGRDLGSPFAANITVDANVTSLTQALWQVIRYLPKLLLFYLVTIPLALVGWFRKLISHYDGDVFTYLVRWDGENPLERWALVNDDGSPVAIRQTLHQMVITKDYIVLLDAAFKFTVDQMYNSINPFHSGSKWLERVARNLLTGPQLPDTVLYLVPREQVKSTPGQRPSQPTAEKQTPPTLTVRKVILPPEALHFLADYDSSEAITLHLAHNSAACFAEWIREYDVSAYPPHEPVDPAFYGMIAIGQMDISRQGRYRIDGSTASLLDSAVVSSLDEPNTYNVGLYAFLDQSVFGQPTPKLTDVYWMGGGFYKELLTKFIYDMYEDYRYRRIPLAEFEKLTAEGKPSNLFHLDTKTMQIVDHFTWPGSHVGLSPQFIPRTGNTTNPTDGYIVCTVVSDMDGAEFWVFDAADLKKPVCILGDPRIDFGVTIHTTWLPTVAPRTAAYKVNIEEDYRQLVRETRNPAVEKLFKNFIYPWYGA